MSGNNKYAPTYSDLENFIYKWNIENPLDRYFRNKYGLRFNSPEHRDSCLIDIAFEYLEDKIFEYKENNYKSGNDDFLKEQKIELPSDEQMMKMFETQDLSYLDDKK